MIINIKELRDLEAEGYLISQRHPNLPLTIWNYSNKTQYERYWNDTTLLCRGLVTDDEGVIVAYPLRKFFNYTEPEVRIPNEPFEIMQKLDGSLIQLFWYKNQWILTSRGSFTSDQVGYAKDLMEIYLDASGGYNFDKHLTYIFELIVPENRVVVDYGYTRDLYLIAVIETETGREHDIYDFNYLFPCPYINQVIFENDVPNWEGLQDNIGDDEEGYVIRFKSGYRMKIKGYEYCRLHKIVTGVSSIDIWNMLKDDEEIDTIIENVPDEFLTFFYKTVGELCIAHRKIVQQVERDWGCGLEKGLYHYLSVDQTWIPSDYKRKTVAEYFNTCQYPSLMFSKFDGKEYHSKVWEMIRPEHQKAFSI